MKNLLAAHWKFELKYLVYSEIHFCQRKSHDKSDCSIWNLECRLCMVCSYTATDYSIWTRKVGRSSAVLCTQDPYFKTRPGRFLLGHVAASINNNTPLFLLVFVLGVCVHLWAPGAGHHTQQNSYSISHLLGTVTTLWLDSDCVVTIDNCRRHGEYTAICSSVSVLPAVFNSQYTVTVQSQRSDCA